MPPHFLSTDLKVAVLVLSLGIDTLAVAIGLGISGIGRKNRLRVGTSFALFEGIMPLIGFFLGHLVNGLLGEATSFLGIIFLFGIGVWILTKARSPDKTDDLNIQSWQGLLFTSFSVSLDELAVGFSMGTLGLPILITVTLIASQAFILTFLGTLLGNKIGEKFANGAELVAGVVLCGLAVLLLLEKVLR